MCECASTVQARNGGTEIVAQRTTALSNAKSALVRVVATLALTVASVASSVAPGLGTPASADIGSAVYTTPGKHMVNGRQWRTSCEVYSTAVYRCRAEIWATQVKPRGSASGYEVVQGWAFNNLTYLPASPEVWRNNPLAATGSFISEGRQWRTECGTAQTGSNACRSSILVDVIESSLDRTGNRQFTPVKKWVLNNIVTFGSTPVAPLIARPQTCAVTVEGMELTLSAGQESITAVRTSGTHATVTMIERIAGTACDTRQVFRDATGRIGYGGTAPAAKRRQDTGTTPAGTFTVREAFGIKANPWTELAWRDVGPNSYWVLDSKSPHYNQWREGTLGGFLKGKSEHLKTFSGQYDYAAVIDYNRSPAVKGKGGAIFMHVHGKAATAGCVSITSANMKLFLNNVGSGDTIVIR